MEKVYTADEFDIMFGTVEDLINLVDVDRLSGNVRPAVLRYMRGIRYAELPLVPPDINLAAVRFFP